MNYTSNARSSDTPQDNTIQLEIVPEDNQQSDIADVEEISREIVDHLRSSDYTVEPTYTGTKGISLFDVIMHVFTTIHNHESLLVAVFTSSSSILQVIIKIRDWRDEKEKTHRAPLEIILEVKGKPITIKTSDAESATKLIEQLQHTHPGVTKEIVSGNDIKIKVKVPKKQRGRKH